MCCLGGEEISICILEIFMWAYKWWEEGTKILFDPSTLGLHPKKFALEPNGGLGYRCLPHVNSTGAMWVFCTDVCSHHPLPMARLSAGTTSCPSTVSQNSQIRKDPVFRLCFLMSSVCKDVVLCFTQRIKPTVCDQDYSWSFSSQIWFRHSEEKKERKGQKTVVAFSIASELFTFDRGVAVDREWFVLLKQHCKPRGGWCGSPRMGRLGQGPAHRTCLFCATHISAGLLSLRHMTAHSGSTLMPSLALGRPWMKV